MRNRRLSPGVTGLSPPMSSVFAGQPRAVTAVTPVTAGRPPRLHAGEGPARTARPRRFRVHRTPPGQRRADRPGHRLTPRRWPHRHTRSVVGSEGGQREPLAEPPMLDIVATGQAFLSDLTENITHVLRTAVDRDVGDRVPRGGRRADLPDHQSARQGGDEFVEQMRP
jgi:hypothetical protein